MGFLYSFCVGSIDRAGIHHTVCHCSSHCGQSREKPVLTQPWWVPLLWPYLLSVLTRPWWVPLLWTYLYLYSLDPGEYLYCDHTCICTQLTLVSTFTVTVPISVLTQPWWVPLLWPYKLLVFTQPWWVPLLWPYLYLYSLNPGDRTCIWWPYLYLYSLNPGEYLYCDRTCICTHSTLVSTFTVMVPVSVLAQPWWFPLLWLYLYLYLLNPGEYLYSSSVYICTHSALVSSFTVTVPVSVLTQPWWFPLLWPYLYLYLLNPGEYLYSNSVYICTHSTLVNTFTVIVYLYSLNHGEYLYSTCVSVLTRPWWVPLLWLCLYLYSLDPGEYLNHMCVCTHSALVSTVPYLWLHIYVLVNSEPCDLLVLTEAWWVPPPWLCMCLKLIEFWWVPLQGQHQCMCLHSVFLLLTCSLPPWRVPSTNQNRDHHHCRFCAEGRASFILHATKLVWLRSKHKMVQTNAYLFWHGHTASKFSGKSALSNHKTTLKQQING